MTYPAVTLTPYFSATRRTLSAIDTSSGIIVAVFRVDTVVPSRFYGLHVHCFHGAYPLLRS